MYGSADKSAAAVRRHGASRRAAPAARARRRRPSPASGRRSRGPGRARSASRPRRRGRAGRADNPGSAASPPAPCESASAANRCCDMSGLSPVPRIPNRPSTMNGIEAASTTATAAATPGPRPPRGHGRRHDHAGERPSAQGADRHRRGGRVPGKPDRAPGDRGQDREPDRRREPGPPACAAEREQRLSDDARGGEARARATRTSPASAASLVVIAAAPAGAAAGRGARRRLSRRGGVLRAREGDQRLAVHLAPRVPGQRLVDEDPLGHLVILQLPAQSLRSSASSRVWPGEGAT